MNQIKIRAFLLGFVFGIMVFFAYAQFMTYYGAHVHDNAPKPGTKEYEDFKKAHPSPPLDVGYVGSPALIYPADVSNDQILLGASHNVFVGKVVAQTGNKETEIGPRTQYQVEVVDNIKGELSGNITLDMLGGYDRDGKLILVEDESLLSGNSLLQPGSTYLLATRYNQQNDWYTVIAHPNARKVLSEDENMDTDQLRALAESDEKARKFKAAYASEILDKADTANNNTRNAFQSLPPEAKAAAQSRADEAKASLASSASAQ